MIRAATGIVLIILAVVFCFPASAQLTDNTSSFRRLPQESYFRFIYDNDYFTKTDEYYSQGVTLEYVHPGLKYFPLSRLLLKARDSNPSYGISLNHLAYTPTSIRSDSILYGDRPFAASLFMRSFSSSSDGIRGERISSAVSIGVLGPAALGEEIQTGIHRWLKNTLPQGWQYQVHNDLLLNYQLNYERRLFKAGSYLMINGTAEARLGTVEDRLSGGFNWIMGHFNDPYQSMKGQGKKLQYYLFGQGRINFIGYDATMQGGIFNGRSPYTLSPGEISRISFQADAGLVLNFKRLFLSYTQSYLSREFRSGHYHRWGGVSLGCSF